MLPGVGVAHRDHGKEVCHDHEPHVVTAKIEKDIKKYDFCSNQGKEKLTKSPLQFNLFIPWTNCCQEQNETFHLSMMTTIKATTNNIAIPQSQKCNLACTQDNLDHS